MDAVAEHAPSEPRTQGGLRPQPNERLTKACFGVGKGVASYFPYFREDFYRTAMQRSGVGGFYQAAYSAALRAWLGSASSYAQSIMGTDDGGAED